MVETDSRSTILRPLSVLLSILVSGTLASYYLKLPSWLGVGFACFTGVTLVLYLTIYVLAFRKDPELLRSEKHSIQKLAIEKGFVGDSLGGMFELKQVLQTRSQLAQANEPGSDIRGRK